MNFDFDDSKNIINQKGSLYVLELHAVGSTAMRGHDIFMNWSVLVICCSPQQVKRHSRGLPNGPLQL